MNGRYSVYLSLAILSMAALISGSTATTLVYALHHSTSSSNNGSPSSTPSNSGSSGSSGSTSSGSGSGGSGLGLAGSPGSGTSSGVVSGGSSNNPTPSSQGGSTAHCDRPGYPSCSSLGSEAGKNAAGTNCPLGHSKAYCSAYNVAAGPSATTTKPGSSTQKGNTSASSVGNNTTSSHQADAAHCDQPTYPSCYSIGLKDGKSNPGTRCPSDHSVNFCAGWNTAAGNPPTNTTPTFAKVTEIAPGAAPGPHTLEYIQAFNIAAGNPYKPGTKQYDDYQAGLDDAMKAGRDCDKMDTCGGPDLLGNYVNGVLHLDDKQYCGNGFGVYSDTLCSFHKGCTANIIGVVACPSPTQSGRGSSSTTTTIVKYIGSPGLGIIQTVNASDRIIMLPSNASDFANNDSRTLSLDFVNPTGPDSIGNYYIKGEVVNNGNTTLQNLKITAHWYDSTQKLIGVTYGYTDSLQPLDTGKRATFTLLGDGHSDLLGKPKFVELSYDWQ
jgi:hypothetical protein